MTKREFLNKKRVAIKRKRRRLWFKECLVNFSIFSIVLFIMRGTTFSFFYAPSLFSAIILLMIGVYPITHFLGGIEDRIRGAV